MCHGRHQFPHTNIEYGLLWYIENGANLFMNIQHVLVDVKVRAPRAMTKELRRPKLDAKTMRHKTRSTIKQFRRADVYRVRGKASCSKGYIYLYVF